MCIKQFVAPKSHKYMNLTATEKHEQPELKPAL